MELIRYENSGAYLISPAAEALIIEMEKEAKAIEERQRAIKEDILKEMEKQGIYKVESDRLAITYIAPCDRERFNGKQFREDNPDLYDEYVTISKVKPSVRIKVK